MIWASIRREERDGRAVYVKQTTYDARLEGRGLIALAEAGAPVPHVQSVDEGTLVLAEVSGTPDWNRLGRTLARVHRSTADRFGLDYDNVIGALAQHNEWCDTWSEFYIRRRIQPWLRALPGSTRARIEGAIAGPMPELLEHGAHPSLLHGDLWPGNVIDGSYLIDPAVCYGDRELDLAFSTVFGAIPREFYDGYEAEWPLDEGWDARRPALQLYHLLVHVELFGRSYVPMVEQRLDRLDW